ncbi:kti12, chromatin associated [Paramarasmius palmivorus]|uniref:Kti12, chromatin associated n=1 Tax=Paramarasmius palmivorus TaxID=297713 RepID=A0AAW0C7V2_9AGAR
MALITISGFPASGKSTRALQIKKFLDEKINQDKVSHLTVAIISDDSLNIPRSVYDESRSEKPARGALFTAIQRQMSSNTILIVDAPNYIKGFRYQMYCAARELKLRVCTVYVLAKEDQCREWNRTRTDGRMYSEETLENLFLRYEEPSSMVRWDSPLFVVLWNEQDIPSSQIWEAVTSGNIKPPNSGTQAVAKAPTDALLILEKTTLSVIAAIMSEQSQRQSIGGDVVLPLSADLKTSIDLPLRTLTLSELQRCKRQFVTVHKKAITLGTTEKGAVDWTEGRVVEKFVRYLEENLKR